MVKIVLNLLHNFIIQQIKCYNNIDLLAIILNGLKLIYFFCFVLFFFFCLGLLDFFFGILNTSGPENSET